MKNQSVVGSVAKSVADDQTWKMVKAIIIAILILNVIAAVIYGILRLVVHIQMKRAEKKLNNAMSGWWN